MISVAMIEPETPGNIGSVARIMKNFGVKQLILINPRCNHKDGEAYGRAMHARNILKNAVAANDFAYLKRFDYVVGTTAALGSDYNVLRSPITPDQLASQLSHKLGKFAAVSKLTSVAVVFGREGTGLTSSEIGRCDVIVTIPSSKTYRALNISHAAAIMLYEIFKTSSSEKLTSHIQLAKRQDKKIAMSMINEILSSVDFATGSRKETQRLVWSRLINKAFLTRREIFALLGFLRKVIKMIKNDA